MDTEAGAAGTPSQGLLSTAEAWTFQSFPSFQARGQPRSLCRILLFPQVTDSACRVVFLTAQAPTVCLWSLGPNLPQLWRQRGEAPVSSLSRGPLLASPPLPLVIIWLQL